MVSKIILFAFVVGTASAATWRSELPEKPKKFAHKEGCYIKTINDVMPFDNTIIPLGECIRIHCRKTYIDYESCGLVSTDDPKCYITKEDLTKPYPACCPEFKCYK
ncbi:hypothetical protein PYW08_011950 [Mythimna loreyi]|uniref:Uncharacterized protein n=1 Tax=Mythimna loreyi TaxID=667449 RepID=A0ACC2QKV3_9NEOP|nr:hypothetical protein PYW08_011950 [Mythimna loreyi]